MTLSDLSADALAAAAKPLSVRNDRLAVKQHSLKSLVELHAYLSSIDSVDPTATQVDAETAVMPGIRTNKLLPGGSV